MTPIQEEGLVIKNYSGFYYVQDHNGQILACKIRGKVKDKILSGDRVWFTRLDTDSGILEKVTPRENQMSRPRVANVTRVLIVMACDQPKPDLTLLDRLLFLSLYNQITPYIVLNKSDLYRDELAEQIISYYPGTFKVFLTSARQGIGLDTLSQAIAGQIAVFAGPSGAGKSSLLKKLVSNTDVATQEVSSKIGRGKHTTRHVELFSLAGGGWLVDTPGFSVLDMPSIRREITADYFPDFSSYLSECRFNNCLHYKEQECGVRQAVDKQAILPSRYQNYVAMLEEIIEKERSY
jgi:ribosome biogenesis GTPase